MDRTDSKLNKLMVRGKSDRFGWYVGLLLLAYVAVGLLTWHRTLLPDEIRPLLLAAGPFADQLEVARADLVQTPAAWALARVWMDVFGHSDAAAKAFALLLNVPTLLLFAVLARRATRYWPAALVLCGAVFMRAGSSPNLVRMYGLVMLCSVAAMLFWDIWRERGGNGWLAAWVLCMAVAVNAHALALLLIPGFVIATWIRGPRRITFTAVSALPVLALVPWILFVLPVYQERGAEANVSAIADEPVRATAKLPFYLLTGEPPGTESPLEELYITHDIPPVLKWSSLLLCMAVMGFSLVGGLVNRATTPSVAATSSGDSDGGGSTAGAGTDHLAPSTQADWVLFSVVLTAVPVVLLLVISKLWLPIVTARYLLAAAPAFWLMLVIHGFRGGRPGRIALGLIAAWMLGSAAFAIRLNMPLAPARIAATRVAAEHQPDDLILIDRHNPLGWQFTWEWTRRLHRSDPVVIVESAGRPIWLRGLLPGAMLEDFDPKGADRVWFLHWSVRLRAPIEERLAGYGYVETDYPLPKLSYMSLFVRTGAPVGGAPFDPTHLAALPRPQGQR